MNRTLGHMAALFTIIIWGITFISTKILLRHISPEEILFIRFLLGWLALILIAPGFVPPLGLKTEAAFALAGFFGVTLYFLLENIALEYTLASNVGVLVSTAPFFTALADWLLCGAPKPPKHFFAGFVLAMTGIILISTDKAVIRISPIGDILAVLAAIAWALYSVITRKLATLNLGPIKTTRRAFFYGLILMLPVLAFTGMDRSLAAIAMPEVFGNLLFLGLGASALCFVTWTWCLVCLGTIQASIYIYLVPVVTVLAATAWLGEAPGLLSIAGMFIVIAGLFISDGTLISLLKNALKTARSHS